MKIVVCVKQVAVLGDEVELDGDGRDVDQDYLDRALNEWDAAALEQALQMKEAAAAGEVIAITVGNDEAEDALRRAMAMGADRAVRIDGRNVERNDPIAIARSLATAVRAEQADLILCGAQSSDHLHGATGTALAGLLDLPVVAVVKRLDYDHAARSARVDRELEGGLVAVTEVQTPAVLTIQTGINQPRYANLRAIKQAEGREIPVVEPEHSPPGARLRRMYVPKREHAADMLGDDPSEVARRIVEIVKERRQ